MAHPGRALARIRAHASRRRDRLLDPVLQGRRLRRRRPVRWCAPGARPTPRAPRSHPDAWWDALQHGDRGAPAGSTTSRRSRSAASSTAWSASTPPARSCAPRCCGTTPAPPRPPLDLIDELGGPQAVGRRGRRWCRSRRSRSPSCAGCADHEPENAARTAAVCLPHDWLTWRLSGGAGLDALVTDRGDASGTGYWSPRDRRRTAATCSSSASGHDVVLPRVLGPAEVAGADAGRRAARPRHRRQRRRRPRPRRRSAATSSSRSVRRASSAPSPTKPVADASGAVAGFADATGRFLPLVATLNAARVLDAAARMLGVDHDGAVRARALRTRRRRRPGAGALPRGRAHPEQAGRDRRAPRAPARDREPRVPRPRRGRGHALRPRRRPSTRCAPSGTPVERVMMVGGAARSAAVREIASAVLGLPVTVPPAGGVRRRGAARQAAWVLAGIGEPPEWPLADVVDDRGRPDAVRARAVRRRCAS